MNRKHLQHRVFFVTPEEGEGGGKPGEDQETAPKPEGEKDEKPAGDKPAGGKPESKDDETDDLDPKARKLVTRANAEAAKFRTELRAAQDALGKAKTVEEFQAATKEFEDKIAALEAENTRIRAIAKHKLPDDLAKELDGVPADKVESLAKALAKYAVADGGSGNLRGGLNPNDDPDEFDPKKAARAARRARSGYRS